MRWPSTPSPSPLAMPADPDLNITLEEAVEVALATEALPQRIAAGRTVRLVPRSRRPYDWQRDE